MATRGFTKIDNSIVFDLDLSLEALGLYIKIKHLATIENFKIRRDHIKSISGYGETAFRRVWKELKDKGVLVETISRNKGKYEYTYTLEKEDIKTENSKKKEKVKTVVDSDGNIPLDGQVHITDLIAQEQSAEITNEEVEEISKETGFKDTEAIEILKIANNNITKVKECFRYVISQENVKNIFNYTKWAIKNNVKYSSSDKVPGIKKKSTFDNFTPRKYDFNKLERALLYGEPYELPWD